MNFCSNSARLLRKFDHVLLLILSTNNGLFFATPDKSHFKNGRSESTSRILTLIHLDNTKKPSANFVILLIDPFSQQPWSIRREQYFFQVKSGAKAYNIMSIDLTPNRVTEETFCYCMPVELAQGVFINDVKSRVRYLKKYHVQPINT